MGVDNIEIKCSNIKDFERNMLILSKHINKIFHKDISCLRDLLSIYISISDLLMRGAGIKIYLGLTYDSNIPLHNAIVNCLTIFSSTLKLLKDGYYGSARVLIRQALEMLLIAKLLEYKHEKRSKWSKADIRPNDVWEYLKSTSRKEKLLILRSFYRELCKFAHHTPYSQQPIYFILSKTDEALSKTVIKAIINTAHTLDLLYITMCMYAHTLNILHRKVRGWYLGYHPDPLGVESILKQLKNKAKKIRNKYLELVSKRAEKEVIKDIKMKVRAYKLNWI